MADVWPHDVGHGPTVGRRFERDLVAGVQRVFGEVSQGLSVERELSLGDRLAVGSEDAVGDFAFVNVEPDVTRFDSGFAHLLYSWKFVEYVRQRLLGARPREHR